MFSNAIFVKYVYRTPVISQAFLGIPIVHHGYIAFQSPVSFYPSHSIFYNATNILQDLDLGPQASSIFRVSSNVSINLAQIVTQHLGPI
jgi:hypothetical protein